MNVRYDKLQSNDAMTIETGGSIVFEWNTSGMFDRRFAYEGLDRGDRSYSIATSWSFAPRCRSHGNEEFCGRFAAQTRRNTPFNTQFYFIPLFYANRNLAIKYE